MRAAERQDFERFVAERSPALLRTAFLLTGDREKAQDLLQDSLVRLFSRWSSIRDPSAREAYLRRILVTTSANQRQRFWNRERSEPVPDAATPHHDPFPEADDRRHCLRAIKGLSHAHRAVIVLRFYEDLTEQQCADLLGLSVGTVKSRTSRALQQLRGSRLLIDQMGETE